MPQISIKALAVSAECVTAHLNELVKEINKMYADEDFDNPSLYNLEQDLLYFSHAELDIKEAYLIEQKGSDDMMSYEDLVGEKLSLNNDS